MTTQAEKSQQALILFAHGARDPRWAEPLQRLQQIVSTQVSGDVLVHQAFLELMTPSLPELIAHLVQQQVAAVTVVPIFLGQGGHVRRDLPELITQLSADYPQVRFTLAPDIGEDEQVLQAIADVCIAQL